MTPGSALAALVFLLLMGSVLFLLTRSRDAR